MPLHNCPNCAYTSHRPFDLRRHLGRKIPCILLNANINTTNKSDTNDSKIDSITTLRDSNTTPSNSNTTLSNSNTTLSNYDIITETNVLKGKQTQCQHCKKKFSNHSNYKSHVRNNKCRGCEPEVCKICLKRFNSTTARATHNRRVVCKPSSPSPPPESSNAPQIINNNTTNNINNTTNNIDNSQNVNIHINFGQEALEKLCSHPDYMKRMEELVRLGKYALPQQISDIYFNDLFPMNNTIQKSRHNDRFVKIKTGDNEWNLRAMDDVYKTLTERMESYMTPYFSHVEKQMEKIYDEDQSKFKRLTRSIREFGHKVLWLDWKCEDIRQIGVELNDPYCENERHRRIQEMKSLLLEHIYEKTREMLSLQAIDNILQ